MQTDHRIEARSAVARRRERFVVPALLLSLSSFVELPAAAQVAPEPEPASTAADMLPCGALETTDPKRLLDVGHGDVLEKVVRAGDRVVAQDANRWVLWDATTGRQVASGLIARELRPARSPQRFRGGPIVDVDLVGDVLMTPGRLSFDLRSARDGRILTTIPLADLSVELSGLARDGSYAYVASADQLRMWDQYGRVLSEQEGSYQAQSESVVSAEPGELRLWDQGLHTIDTLTTTGERRSSAMIEGGFYKWFLDGSHFIIDGSTSYLVYRSDGVRVKTVPKSNPDASGPFNAAGGIGQFVWFYSEDVVYVFRLDSDEQEPDFIFDGQPLDTGRSDWPVFSLAQRRFGFLSLDGDEPVLIERAMPAAIENYGRVSMDRDGAWALPAPDGLLYTSTLAESAQLVPLGCGRPLAISTAGDQLAVSTADRRIRIFDLAGGQRKLVRTLEISAGAMEFAADGRYLVLRNHVRGPVVDSTLHAVDAVSGALVQQWPEAKVPIDVWYDFTTARHAERLASVTCSFHCGVLVKKLDGTVVFAVGPFEAPLGPSGFSLSPNGRRLTWSSMRASLPSGDVIIYEDGKEVATVKEAVSADWLDDERLLIGHIDVSGKIVAHVADARGETIRVMKGEGKLARIRGDSSDYYVKDDASVYSLVDGALVWEPARGLGMTPFSPSDSVVFGKQVGFYSGHYVGVDALR